MYFILVFKNHGKNKNEIKATSKATFPNNPPKKAGKKF